MDNRTPISKSRLSTKGRISDTILTITFRKQTANDAISVFISSIEWRVFKMPLTLARDKMQNALSKVQAHWFVVYIDMYYCFSAILCRYLFLCVCRFFFLHFRCFFTFLLFFSHFCRFIYFHVSMHPLISRCTLVSFACWIMFVLKLKSVFFLSKQYAGSQPKRKIIVTQFVCSFWRSLVLSECTVSEHKNDKRTSCSMVCVCVCVHYSMHLEQAI